MDLTTNITEEPPGKNPPVFVVTTINFLPLGLILLVICVFGLLGNILSVMVLLRPKMKSTYSTTTLGLTIFDIIYLLTKFFRYALASFLTYFSVGTYYTHFFLPTIGPELRAITFTAHTGSTYFTIVVAFDRYVAVTWPIQSKFMWSKLRVLYSCVFVTIFAILFNIPRWLEFRTEPGFDRNNEILAYEMKLTDLRKNPDYILIYTFWIYFFVMFLFPFVSLTYLNFTIGWAIWKANHSREQLSTTQKRDNSFALMLIAVVIVFLICSLDYLVIDWLDYYKIHVLSFWQSLGNVLLTINSAINFIIYCLFGKRFREEFIIVVKEFKIVTTISNGIKRGSTKTKINNSNGIVSMSGKKSSNWYSAETSSSSAGTDSEEPRI